VKRSDTASSKGFPETSGTYVSRCTMQFHAGVRTLCVTFLFCCYQTSPRGRTYTIRYHSQVPSDAEECHHPKKPAQATSSASSLRHQSSSGSRRDACGTSSMSSLTPQPGECAVTPTSTRSRNPFGKSVLDSLPILNSPPPTTGRNDTVPGQNEFRLPPPSPTLSEEDLNLLPQRQLYSLPASSFPSRRSLQAQASGTTVEDFQFHWTESSSSGFQGSELPRPRPQTRSFTRLEEEDLEGRFWLPSPRCSVTEYNNNSLFGPPPLPAPIHNVAKDVSIQTTPSDWLLSYGSGQRCPRPGNYEINNHCHYEDSRRIRFEEEDPDLAAIVPPPTSFRNEEHERPLRSVTFLPPPTPFADDEELSPSQRASASTLLAHRGSKTKYKKTARTVRRRPAMTYPVEDFIFKKGMKSPVPSATAPKHGSGRKSPNSKMKPVPRFRR